MRRNKIDQLSAACASNYIDISYCTVSL